MANNYARQQSMDTTGIIVQLYCDIDETKNQIVIQEFGKEYFAEELILMGCKEHKIGPSGFYIFGLISYDFTWQPPNKKIKCREDIHQEFWLRVRYIPSLEGINCLLRDSKEALNYFFLQCRHDFCHDKIEFKSNTGQEHILGLGVVDMLRWGKEKKKDLVQLKKVEPKKFIPPSSKKSFKYPWDTKRLNMNFYSELEKLYNKEDLPIAEYKVRYLNGFLKYTSKYGIEKFDVLDTEKTHGIIIVDPHHEPAIYAKYGQKPKIKEEEISSIQDVMFISLQVENTNSNCRVTVSRKQGIPKTLIFAERETGLSFTSLIDGYYRLMEDFHFHVCDEVSSPMLSELSRIKSHGPVKKKWVDERLMQKHLKQHNFNYLIKQKSNEYDCYIVSHVIHQQKPQLSGLVICKNEEGRWKFKFNQAPTFPSVEKLLQYYRKNNDPNIALDRYVPPSPPLDSSIFLCREIIENDQNESHVNHDIKSQVGLVSGINEKLIQRVIGEGNFTVLYQQLWEKDPDHLQKVAVKRLKQQFSPQYLEEFMESMHRVTFWKCPTLITIQAICLNPFQVVLEYAEQGNLENYLNDYPVAEEDYANIADQIAQALLHIHGSQQEYSSNNSGFHGVVRCKNVFVFGNDTSSGSSKTIKVKLGDPGLVSLYNKLQLDNTINEERLPWIAPELYSPKVNLVANNQYSDIYSYGVFLWEVFSGGDRPFKSLNLRQIMTTVIYKEGLGPPEGCSKGVAELVKKCTQLDTDKRPNIKEIVRDLGTVIHECGGKHMYNQAISHQQGTYSMDSGEEETVVPESEQMAVIDNLLEQSKMTSYGQSHATPLFRSPSQFSTSRVPPSSAASSATSFDPWDSRTPLVPPTSSRHESIDLNISDTSRATTMTLITDGEFGADDASLHVIQKRPLPPKPTTVPLDEMDHIVHPDRLQVNSTILGKGHYGEVHTARYKLASGEMQKVAVKSLREEMCNRFHKEFDRECQLMTQLEHPNIVQIIGQCSEKENHNTLLVMEFVENGCLRDYLYKLHPDIKSKLLPNLLRFALEVAEGMIYLSEKNIVHRDLAARNVLVTKDIHMKISDFGLARTLAAEKDYYSMTDREAEIPIFWCAPESINPRKFSIKSDVWSYGVTMWEIYTFGKPPRLGNVESLWHILNVLEHRLPKPEACHAIIYENVMKKCWLRSPADRLSFQQISELLKQHRNTGLDENGSPGHNPSMKFKSDSAFRNRTRDATDRTLRSVEPPKFQLVQKVVRIPNGLETDDHKLTVPKPQLQTRKQSPVEQSSKITGTVPSFMPPTEGIQARSLPKIPPTENSHDLDYSKLSINYEESLGHGHYGKVFKGTYNHSPVAIKLLKAEMYDKHATEFDKECHLMTMLKHPNIVKVIGQCKVEPQDENTAELGQATALVLELIPKGCLTKHLKSIKDIECMSTAQRMEKVPELIRYLKEVAEGMQYLHSKSIVHRDLATRNVLVTSDYHMKISDFGLARVLAPDKDYYKMLDQKNIPRMWCAPESLGYRKFSAKSDIWSFGILMWEVFMLSTQPKLCNDSGLLKVLKDGRRLALPRPLCTKEIYNEIMMKCWEMEPSDRPSFLDIIDLFSKY